MRVALAFAIVVHGGFAGCQGWQGSEVVQGFHGYEWGTHFTEIPEIADGYPSSEREGLAVFSAGVTLLGRPAQAAFLFHPRTGGLVEGQYSLALSLEECEREWARYLRSLEEAYANLQLEREAEQPVRPPSDVERYTSDCEYFVFNSETLEWFTAFVNPERPNDRAGLRMRTVGRSLHLTLFYRGGVAQAWSERPGRVPRRSIFPTPPPLAPPPDAPHQPGILPFGRA